MSEKEVFIQKVSDEEMEAVAGGEGVNDYDYDCVSEHWRDIYFGGFPNCAATVEEGSLCDTNDACVAGAVVYKGMHVCYKAWT